MFNKTSNRMMTNICSDNLAESRDFYTKLFDFSVDCIRHFIFLTRIMLNLQ
jgi:hypothetical protein